MNLASWPDIFRHMGLNGALAQQQQPQPTDATDVLRKKKKLMAAGENSDFATAVSTLFGSRLGTADQYRAV